MPDAFFLHPLFPKLFHNENLRWLCSVNKFLRACENNWFIGELGILSRLLGACRLITRCITIRCRLGDFGYDDTQFIERTKRAVAVERMKLFVSRIIPGDWGKVGSGWLIRPLRSRPEGRWRRRNSLVPLARSRVPVTRAGTERSGTIRNRSESSQVVQAGFESGQIAVTLRVNGCYCASARADGSEWLQRKRGQPDKDAEKRNKKTIRAGKNTTAGQAA